MIGILDKGHYIKGLLEYHFKKIDRGEGEILDTNIYSENKKDQLLFFLNTFNNSKVTSRSDLFCHSSLSFSPQETVEREKMITIAKEYMYRMGYRDVPYTVFLHKDKAHQHFHIVASRINYDGQIAPKLYNKTSFDKKISREQCQILEKKYDLIIAQSKSKSERHQEFLQERNMQKYAIGNGIKKGIRENVFTPQQLQTLKFFTQSEPQIPDTDIKKKIGSGTFTEIQNLLDERQLITYSKKSTLVRDLTTVFDQSTNSIEFLEGANNNNLYARKLLDKNEQPYMVYGMKDTNFYITEKSLPNQFRFNSIDNISNYKTAKQEQAQKIQSKKALVSDLFEIYKTSRTQAEFEAALESKNIKYKYSKTNQSTQIQGISFYDAQSMKYFKATELHRSLSWRKLDNKFKSNQLYTQTKNHNKDNKSKKEQSSKATKSETNVTNNSNGLFKLRTLTNLMGSPTSNDKGKTLEEIEKIKRDQQDQSR